MNKEKRNLKIKLKDDKGKYYEVISTEQFNIQEELNKEIEINIKYKQVLDKIKEYIKDNGDMLINDYDTLEEINKILEEIE